jgi:transcriptional regulator with XRE-family HTH domain
MAASNERFGAFLQRLRMRSSLTAKEVAHSLGVDRSLYYRWERQERLPTTYLQVQAISQLLGLSTREHSRLVTIWESDLVGRRARRRPASHATRARVLAHEATHHGLQRESVAPELERLPGGVGARPAIGSQEVLDLVIGFLERSGSPAEPGAQLLMTAQGSGLIGDDAMALTRWHRAIEEAMTRGWSISALLRLDRNLLRTVQLVRQMLNLLGPSDGGRGVYEPRYFKPYGLLAPPYDVIVARGHGAVILFASHQPHVCDAAFEIPWAANPRLVLNIEGHVRLLQAQTKPLVRIFSATHDDRLAFEEHIALAGMEGDHGLVEAGISTLLHPPQWHTAGSPWARLLEGRLGEQVLQRLLHLRRLRLEQFLNGEFRFRAVSARQVLLDLAEHGIYATTEFGSRECVRTLPPDERVAFLTHLIQFIDRHRARFQLALVDPAEQARLVTPLFWLVAGGSQVLMETWRVAQTQREELGLLIDEPTIAGAFQDAFDEIWGEIAPSHYEPDDVIQWVHDAPLRIAQRKVSEQ